LGAARRRRADDTDLRGALGQLLSPETGALAYLEEIRLRSAAFHDAADLLSTQQLARVENWPTPPVSLLVSHIRQWWRMHRQGWTKTIHDAYGALGEGLMWPLRWARQRIGGGAPDLRAAYRDAERNVMLQAIDSLYGELTRLSQLGNDLLRPRLDALLAGASRAQLLERLTAAQASLDLDAELSAVVAIQMQGFRDENPKAFGVFRKLDAVAAMARPVTSVVLFVAAAGPVGHALTPLVTDAAAQSLAVHIMGDIAGGTGAVVVGETALSGTAGGLRLLETRLRQLQAAFTARRVAWFADFLRQNVLGNLHGELNAAAQITATAAYQNVRASLERLSQEFRPQ